MDKYQQLSTLEKERFAAICNKLLATCFMYKHTDKDYYFILTHLDVFEEYFAISNWEISVDHKLETICLSCESNINRYRFSLKETIIILLLRVAFEKQLRNVARHDKVVISIADLQSSYQTLKMRERNIDKVGLINALSTLRRFNIIDLVMQNDNFASSLIVINPTILALIKVQNIREVFDYIESLGAKGEDNATFEEIAAD